LSGCLDRATPARFDGLRQIFFTVSYQVFARKYRPQTFAEVVGQGHVTRTLANAIDRNRLAHAYLFVGPRGTGKTSTARILAKALNCHKGPTIEPCGVCPACIDITLGKSLDVLEIDGASNNNVDDIRELRENVAYAPPSGKFRIYIIDEVHMLTPQAFNALLKTLEEPPPHVKFIFATTDVQKVLPTILSRCQRFDLRKIPTALIARHLLKIAANEKIQLDADAAEIVARGADGGLRDAESMLDQLVAFCGDAITRQDAIDVFGLTGLETVAALARAIFSGDTPAALAEVHTVEEGGRDLLRLTAELIVFLRNMLVHRANPAGLGEEAGELLLDHITPLQEFTSTERLIELIDLFADAEGKMRWAAKRLLHLEVALVRACELSKVSTFDDVLAAVEDIRAGRAPKAKAAQPTAAPVVIKKAKVEADLPDAPLPVATTAIATEAPKIELPPKVEPVAKATPAPEPEVLLQPKVELSPKSPPEVSSSTKAEPELETSAPLFAAEPEEEPAPIEATGAADLDPEWFWQKFIQEISRQKPLLANSANQGRLLSLEEGVCVIGIPDAHRFSAERLLQKAEKTTLDKIASQIAGRPMQVQIDIRDGLEVSPMDLSGIAEAQAEAASGKLTMEEFKNDPALQKALALFGGEIESIQPHTTPL